MISGNMVGSYSQIGKTFILQDENGNEVTGVVVDQATVFDATVADVRIGKTFASDEGVQQGENTITYRTEQGTACILPGEDYTIPLSAHDSYDYTKLQCIVTKYTEDVNNRMAAYKIVLNNSVYEVNSSVALSTVTKNSETKSIDFNIANDTNDIYVIHYFTYKEEAF